MTAVHRVTAACAVARTTDEGAPEVYLYRDALLPANVSAEERARLVNLGLVEEDTLVVIETVSVQAKAK